MATIGTITIAIEAGTATFNQQIEKAGEHLTILGHIAEGTHGIMEHFVEGLGIGSGIAAFETATEAVKQGLDKIKEAYEQVNQIGHDALKLGISAEQMSRFQHAANATGTDISALTTGMDHLNRQIGLVASGDKSAAQAAKAFGQLHIDINALASSSPDAAFKQIAEGLQTVHSQFERAAIAQEVFGRGGRELAPIMAHLQDLMQESDDIGFTRTTEGIEKAEQMERQMAKSTDTLKGALMDLATSDFASTLVEQFGKTASSFKDRPSAILSSWVRLNPLVIVSMHYTTTKISDFTKPIESHVNTVGELRGKIKATNDVLAGSKDLEEKVSAARELSSAYKELYPLTIKLRGEQSQQEGHSGITYAGLQDLHQQVTASNALLGNLTAMKRQRDDLAASAAADLKVNAAAYDKNITSVLAIRDALQKQVDETGLTGGAKRLAEAIQLIHDKRAMLARTHTQYSEQEQAADEAMIQSLIKLARKADAVKASLESAQHSAAAFAHLKEQFDSIGKNSGQKLLSEIEKSNNLSPAQKGAAEQWQRAIDAFEHHKKQIEEAHSLLERLATPAQKYAAEVAKINELQRAGALTAAEALRLKEAAQAKQVGDKDQHAGAEVRRFDFRVPGNAAGLHAEETPALRAAESSDRRLGNLEEMMRDLVNKVVNNFGGVDTPPPVFDIT